MQDMWQETDAEKRPGKKVVEGVVMKNLPSAVEAVC